MKKFCKDYKSEFSFVCYSWVSVAKNHILGVVISVSDMWFPYDNAIGRGNEILDSEHNGVCVRCSGPVFPEPRYKCTYQTR